MSDNTNKRTVIPDSDIYGEEDLDLKSSKANDQSIAEETNRNIRSTISNRPIIKSSECFYEPSAVENLCTSSIEKHVINTLLNGPGLSRNGSKNHTSIENLGEGLSKYSGLPKLVISEYENESENESSDEYAQSDTAKSISSEHSSPVNIGSPDNITNDYKYISKESIVKINASFRSFEESLIHKIKQYSINFFSNFHELKTSTLFQKSYINSTKLTNSLQNPRKSKFASIRSQEIKCKNSFINDEILNGFRSLQGNSDDPFNELFINKKFHAFAPKMIESQKSVKKKLKNILNNAIKTSTKNSSTNFSLTNYFIKNDDDELSLEIHIVVALDSLIETIDQRITHQKNKLLHSDPENFNFKTHENTSKGNFPHKKSYSKFSKKSMTQASQYFCKYFQQPRQLQTAS
ncbi:hypothetical protein AYI69_g10229 [Smittium culicis]|uniref:Uncharacterized protein n=1 Tax=Smittium culicis TaxID=133412 RepID=A0A1R1X799_9FUNG|nr:hypothetical protein AYI69_g10229 [Smittium culicis]